ncbi:MAG: CsgG/HfaB family protein [Elusimicrobiales bacterium]|nr:CsgG/HfaB family protein [Elusimicrobiales bacterium]
MRTGTTLSAVLFAAVIIHARPLAAAPSADEVYRRMAADFASSMAAKKIKTVAMAGFSRRARASEEESEYAAEKLTEHLSRTGKASVFERSRLESLLREQRLGHSGAAEQKDRPGGLAAVEAVITGTIFGTGDKLRITARLVNPRSGEIIHALEGETDRHWDLLPEVMQFLVPLPDIERLHLDFKDVAVYPGTFRDAPGPGPRDRCEELYGRLHERQTELLHEKARFWALRMREPGFARKKLTRNPGAEISDPELRKAFYEALRSYYRAGGAVRLTDGEREKVADLAEDERRAADECGLR